MKDKNLNNRFLKNGDLVIIKDEWIVAPKFHTVSGIVVDDSEAADEVKVFHPQIESQPFAWWNSECLELVDESR